MTLKRNATTTLITVICAFYLLQLIHPSIEQDLFLIRKAGFADGLYHGVQTGEWYRIITVALIHGGLMHLAFNMYALLVLGNPLEYAFGKVKFLSIFFISLITGSLASLWLNPSNVPSVGASGALFGLFGAFAVAGRKIGADVKSILVLIGINFAFTFIVPNVDWHAHVGGLIGGAIAAFFLLRSRV